MKDLKDAWMMMPAGVPQRYERLQNDVGTSCHIQSPTTFPLFVRIRSVTSVPFVASCGFEEMKLPAGQGKIESDT